jgi:hypothetical protein
MIRLTAIGAGIALAVLVGGSVDDAGARECCNVTCGLASPRCLVSDVVNCDQLCDTACASSGGCTTFSASTCAPGLAVESCDAGCQAVCATFTPVTTPTSTPATAPAPTLSPGALAFLAAALGGLAVVALRRGIRPRE